MKFFTTLLFFINFTSAYESDYVTRDFSEYYSKLFNNEISKIRIEENLQFLTKTVHRAGTAESLAVADQIRQRFVDIGLDKVETEDYNVLLSYPNISNPDTVSIVDQFDRAVVNISSGTSKFLVKDEEVQKDANIRFVAFAHEGKAKSEKLVYVNYGRVEDFDLIEKQFNLSLNSTIVLIRYGKIWRGAKVKNAQDKGAIGVLLYSDPADASNNFTTEDKTFPNSVFMPPDGVQRGTVVEVDSGDQLTPLLPAKDYVIRRDIQSLYDVRRLPTIPVTPISYTDAYQLITRMTGPNAPHEWQGGLQNVSYKIGPNLQQENQFVKMDVTTYPETRKIQNVVGYLKGDVEPDRYVIIGNHHDSWVYGAMDPSSGTAVLLEVARALAALVKLGWRPRRTIMFCAWDGEEYGIVGSSEYVEQYLRRLESRAIAYLNIDNGVTGRETISAQSVPLLERVLFQAAKKVVNPDPSEIASGRLTVYDTWLHKIPDKKRPNLPMINLIGSGSDYRHFLDYVGIPSLDFRYANAKNRGYSLYHTLHETMYLVKNFVDPDFSYHQAVARMWGQMTLLLSDSLLIPFNVSDYSSTLKDCISSLENVIGKEYKSLDANISVIRDAYPVFENATKSFQKQFMKLKETEMKKMRKVKSINDRLQMLERMFIIPGGIPERAYLRHVIFAPSRYNSYSGVSFAGIMDTLDRMSKTRSAEMLKQLKVVLNDQISWAANCIHSASQHLISEW